MWRSTGFQSLSYHDVARCCDGSISFIHDERERTVSPCLEDADRALERAEQRVKAQIKNSRHALMRFTLKNQRVFASNSEKRKRTSELQSGKENAQCAAQAAIVSSGAHFASKRARTISMAALTKDDGTSSFVLKRHNNQDPECPKSHEACRIEVSEKPFCVVDVTAPRAREQRQSPTVKPLTRSQHSTGAGKRSSTIKLEAGSYKLQPRVSRASTRILPLPRERAARPLRLVAQAGAW